MSAHALEELLAAFGEDCEGVITTDDDARFAASYDNLRVSVLPQAVIRPRDEEDVQLVLRVANEHKVPVTARGGGSGACGGAVPLKGGWVVDLSGWDHLHIDGVTGLAYVQPGVLTKDLADAALAEGLFYPPDPSSQKYCTIGGNIACNAGGMRAAKYGVTRDYVVALEGFLPTGDWVRWGMDLKKFTSGYNLRDLWVGDEGTLGIITGAVMKLVPAPEARWTALAVFEDEADALDAACDLLAQRVLPSTFEFIDRQSTRCLQQWLAKRSDPALSALFESLGIGGSSVLLVEVDGSTSEVGERRKAVEAWAQAHARGFREAASEEEAEALREVRRKCSPAMYDLGNTKLNEDVVVPVEAQAELVAHTIELNKELGLATPTYGHCADGNLHVHIMYNREDDVLKAKARDGIQSIMEKVVELGGCITGEHGIGLAKTPFLRMQHSEAEIRAMQAVKRALDPNNILNPGKIFEPFEMWDAKFVDVVMPWDH